MLVKAELGRSLRASGVIDQSHGLCSDSCTISSVASVPEETAGG